MFSARDGSTANFAMPQVGSFFGITSDLLIGSIHLGLADGVPFGRGATGIDDLTIGSRAAVPEPVTAILFGLGSLGALSARRRNKA